MALIYLNGFRVKDIQNPWKTYLNLSAVLMGSQGLTKGSLMFLNYPAQIMFKSTKVPLLCIYSASLQYISFQVSTMLDLICIKSESLQVLPVMV